MVVDSNNPHWDTIWPLLQKRWSSPEEMLDVRASLCRQYCWAVPAPQTIAFLARFLAPRAVEIGVGTGYLCWQLSQLEEEGCVDILGYDTAPPDRVLTNGSHSPFDREGAEFLYQPTRTYYPIELGGPEVLARHADRTLFLCWLPPLDDMALECLDCYPGRRLVYLGLLDGYHCGTEGFLGRLGEEWQPVAEHVPPQWPGIDERAVVYERKGAGP